jgi:hypothetical protein
MKFSNYPSIEFPLDMHYTRAGVLKAIDNINYLGGGTNTAEAINYMNRSLRNPEVWQNLLVLCYRIHRQQILDRLFVSILQ